MADVNGDPQPTVDPSLREQQVPDVEPGSDPGNLAVTRVPTADKPVAGAEFNPGSREYAEQAPRRPASTDAATGGGAISPGKPAGSNQPPPPGR